MNMFTVVEKSWFQPSQDELINLINDTKSYAVIVESYIGLYKTKSEAFEVYNYLINEDYLFMHPIKLLPPRKNNHKNIALRHKISSFNAINIKEDIEKRIIRFEVYCSLRSIADKKQFMQFYRNKEYWNLIPDWFKPGCEVDEFLDNNPGFIDRTLSRLPWKKNKHNLTIDKNETKISS